VLLETDRPSESALFSRAVRQDSERSVQGAVLQAAAFVARRNLNDAREAVSGLNELGGLADYDRLRLARVYVELERWDDLARALQELDDVDPVLAYERDLFRSMWLIYVGSLAEADAVLAFLLEQKQNDYEAVTWRGVVLMRARQPEAARGALVRAADLDPGRPEAWYWLAVLEINNENDEAGEQHLNKSLAASALYAPAWEALATIALKSGDVDAALDRLSTAARHDAGRPNVHLLIAFSFAQKEQREQAAAALRTAFALAPAIIDRAAEMDALTQMFERAELESVLPGEPPSDSAENP
jgi:Flp pilus assembly protein TadD